MAVFVYTEQETSPRFFEVIKGIKSAIGIDDLIVPVAAMHNLSPTVPVVVFGKIEDPEYKHPNNIFTYSPAQVVTKANSVTVVGTAFKRAAGRLPEVAHGPASMHLVHADAPTYEAVGEFDALYDAEELVVDIEVSGNIKTGTPEDEDVKLLTVAFYNPDKNRSVVFQGAYYSPGYTRMERALATFFKAYRGKLIYHNGKFDVRVLNRILRVRVNVDEDTMLMHHVLNQAAGNHKLKDLCKLYFNAPEWEGDLKKYTKGGGHYENIPLDILAEYNALDVYWTYVLYKFLKAQLEADEDAQRAYQLELEASAFLLRVEERGIPFDTEAADKLAEECQEEMDDELFVMRHITKRDDFNPNSPKQVKEALAEMGEEVPATSVEVLEELRDKLDATEEAAIFITSLLRYRKAAKISSTYVKGWKNKARNGLVHPTFLVHGTSTGRLSSTSPNAQNMPRNKKVRAIVGI